MKEVNCINLHAQWSHSISKKYYSKKKVSDSSFLFLLHIPLQTLRLTRGRRGASISQSVEEKRALLSATVIAQPTSRHDLEKFLECRWNVEYYSGLKILITIWRRFHYLKGTRQAWGLALNSIQEKNQSGRRISQQNKWKMSGGDKNKYALWLHHTRHI